MADQSFAGKLTWGGLFVFSLNKLVGFSLLKCNCCHAKSGCEPFLMLPVGKGKSRGSEGSMWFLHIDSAWPPSSCLPTWCNCNWKYLRGRKRTACFRVAWLRSSSQASPERMQKTWISLPRDLLHSLPCKLLSFATELNRVFCSGGVSRMVRRWLWHRDVDEALWILKATVCVSVEGQWKCLSGTETGLCCWAFRKPGVGVGFRQDFIPVLSFSRNPSVWSAVLFVKYSEHPNHGTGWQNAVAKLSWLCPF